MGWNWQQAIGGAGSGAAAGAKIGSVAFPGVGTAWGAGIGAGAGALMGLLGDGSKDSKPMSPELERLYNREVSKMEASNPLYEAVMQLAFNRMPTASRDGLTMPTLASATHDQTTADGAYREPSADADYTGSERAVPRTGAPGDATDLNPDERYGQPKAVRLLMRQQELRQRMADPIIQAITKLAQSRMPRGYTGGGFPGLPGAGGGGGSTPPPTVIWPKDPPYVDRRI